MAENNTDSKDSVDIEPPKDEEVIKDELAVKGPYVAPPWHYSRGGGCNFSNLYSAYK